MCVFKSKGLSRYSVIKILVRLEEHLRIEGVSWEFSGVPFPGDLLWGGPMHTLGASAPGHHPLVPHHPLILPSCGAAHPFPGLPHPFPPPPPHLRVLC